MRKPVELLKSDLGGAFGTALHVARSSLIAVSWSNSKIVGLKGAIVELLELSLKVHERDAIELFGEIDEQCRLEIDLLKSAIQKAMAS